MEGRRGGQERSKGGWQGESESRQTTAWSSPTPASVPMRASPRMHTCALACVHVRAYLCVHACGQ